VPESLPLLMDRAYEGNESRKLVLDLGMIPVVPPKSNRPYAWDYDRALYKNAMRSNGSSADLKVFSASFPVSKNSMLSFSPFCRLLLSSKH
jgi:hypothetical protein